MKKIIVSLAILILLLTGCKDDKGSNSKALDWIKEFNNTEKEEFIEDIDFLVNTLEDVHPNPWAYRRKEDFLSDVNSIKSSLKDSLTKTETTRIVASLLATLKDGHTKVELHNLYSYFSGYNVKTVPFKLEIRDNSLYVVESYGNENPIEPGSQILKINGKESSKIVDDLCKYISGERKEYKEVKLESFFPFLYFLKYENGDKFNIVYKTEDKKLKERVNAVELNRHKEPYYREEKSNYKYEFLNQETCYLDFNSFENYDVFKMLLKRMFSEIENKGSENLIIDIRGNGGGNSRLGDLLFSYLYEKPFYQFKTIRVKISSQVGNNQNNTVGTIFEHMGSESFKFSNKNIFKGRVILLTDRFTFSSATDFSALIKDFGVGIIIGEETGGIASSYGDNYSGVLPNSRISFTISHKYFIRPSGEEGPDGVIPDIKIKQPLESKINREDSILNYALEYFKSDYDDYLEANPNRKKAKDIEGLTILNRDEIVKMTDTISEIFFLISTGNHNIKKYVGDIPDSEIINYSKSVYEEYGDIKNISFNRGLKRRDDDGSINYNIYFNLVGEKRSAIYYIDIDSDMKIKSLHNS